MVEGAALEMLCRVTYRGFESLPLRFKNPCHKQGLTILVLNTWLYLFNKNLKLFKQNLDFNPLLSVSEINK